MLNKLQQNGERCTSFIAAVNSAVSRWLTARDWNISLLFTFPDARDSEFSRKDSYRESEQLHSARSCRKRGEKIHTYRASLANCYVVFRACNKTFPPRRLLTLASFKMGLKNITSLPSAPVHPLMRILPRRERNTLHQFVVSHAS